MPVISSDYGNCWTFHYDDKILNNTFNTLHDLAEATNGELELQNVEL